jgi:hypothetical protein
MSDASRPSPENATPHPAVAYDDGVRRTIPHYDAIHGEVMSSAESLIRDPNELASATERDRWEDAIGWVDDGDDALARRLAETIAAVEHVCRPLIADQHRLRLTKNA